MIGHHISEHARQKILKEIAIRAQKQVLDMTYNWYESPANSYADNSLITCTGSSKYQFFRKSAPTLKTSWHGSNTPRCLPNPSCFRPRPLPRPGKLSKCSPLFFLVMTIAYSAYSLTSEEPSSSDINGNCASNTSRGQILTYAPTGENTKELLTASTLM